MNIKRALVDPNYRFILMEGQGLYNYLPDKEFVIRKTKARLGIELDLDNPKTFNEKIQWLKLYDHNDIYTTMVDKFLAKKYVAEILGEKYIIPNYGCWPSFEKINFDELPNEFVLKCTHDSGGIAICKDKKKFDINKAKTILSKHLKHDYYLVNREWPYKNVRRMIIAEKYMTPDDGRSLIDYKFYCFNGKPLFLYVSYGLDNHKTARISFVDLNWNALPFWRSDYKPFDVLPPRPTCFDEMLDVATKLSDGFPFVRVDLYQINGSVFFSELTLSPCGGMLPFEPVIFDQKIGELLELPIDSKIDN